MVTLQILNKILKDKDLSIITDNCLDVSYFSEYEDEFNYILNHFNDYGNVPDTTTFLENFPEFKLIEVTETNRYLMDKLNEEHTFTMALPFVQDSIDMMNNGDSHGAINHLLTNLNNLNVNPKLGGIDIIANADKRFEEYKDRKENKDNWFFTTGLPELDDVINGIQRTEEFFVILARTHQCKSWIIAKICTHIWNIGFNVGFISPEMSPSSIGYRFDTLYKNFSNKDLFWGKEGIDEKAYEDYINELKTRKNKFIVATKKDFGSRITVSKLKQFVLQNKLDIVAIDGITYMADERGKKGDTKATALTNISEDLMNLSIEIGVPIMVVVQANRNGAGLDDEETPELEHMRDSDGIAFNASKVISLKHSKEDNVLTLQVKKQRNGLIGTKVRYIYNINTGEFIPMANNAGIKEKRKIDKKEDVF